MKRILANAAMIVFSILFLSSCGDRMEETPENAASSETAYNSEIAAVYAESEMESVAEESEVFRETESVQEKKDFSFIMPEGDTLESRFALPEGYIRTEYPEESFGSFVRRYPVKPDGSPVLLWTKEPKGNQTDHVAVFDMTVEDELDVQQCADSVMRMYAEYFRATGQYDRIRFHFVNGFLCDYNSYIQGNRVKVNGDEVVWVQSKEPEDSEAVFNEYMKIVFAYSSTLSMEGESTGAEIQEMQIGDIFLKGGSPGHVVMVADVCEKDGRKAFLLAQGYMPAQEFHIIKNPLHENDPWYYEEEVQYPFHTQAYTFPEGSFRRLQY